MYKALKNNKIIAISEKKEVIIYTEDGDIIQYIKGEALFPCLEFDEVIEDTEHTVNDYTLYNDEFLLNSDEKVIEQQKTQIRSKRDSLLQKTDKFMISDYPITEDERQKIKSYREYLRDYTLIENWWQQEPNTFEEWLNNLK